LTYALLVTLALTRPGFPIETPVNSALEATLATSLKEVINRGVDLYNGGEIASCYRLYEGALRAIKPLLQHRPELVRVIDEKLAEADKEAVGWRKAFALRAALDKVRGDLNKPTDPESDPSKRAEAQKKAEEEATKKAEMEALKRAEEKKIAEAEEKKKADEEAMRLAEEKKKAEAEAEAKKKADEEAKKKADEEAKKKADAKKQLEDDKKKSEPPSAVLPLPPIAGAKNGPTVLRTAPRELIEEQDND
jgi:chemotaxis protein histidine kinase CheA